MHVMFEVDFIIFLLHPHRWGHCLLVLQIHTSPIIEAKALSSASPLLEVSRLPGVRGPVPSLLICIALTLFRGGVLLCKWNFLLSSPTKGCLKFSPMSKLTTLPLFFHGTVIISHPTADHWNHYSHIFCLAIRFTFHPILGLLRRKSCNIEALLNEY